MNDLSDQRCFHHHQREAVVRCPDCGRYFCRECVTEHHDRMLCVQCLRVLTGERQTRSSSWIRGVVMLAQGTFGFVLLWYAFYIVGLLLLSIPHDFHEGTIWESSWWREK